jgi:DNA polymerase-3 subunit chi
LWTFEQLEFVPHARLAAGEQVSAALLRTPIWLVDPRAHWPQADVVVNLGHEAIDAPQRFARLIEIVGEEPDDVQAGRARWRHYATLGLTPVLANAKNSPGQAAEESAATK